jgi:choline dehydrogenase-like flavoprotein
VVRAAGPEEEVADAELGPVDRALLAAAPDAERAILTRRNGRRVTAAEASLWPALVRPNLVVRAASPVERLEFDQRRVTGVRLVDGSTVAAERVVLSAGAIHSPTILLRSQVDTEGIGTGSRTTRRPRSRSRCDPAPWPSRVRW